MRSIRFAFILFVSLLVGSSGNQFAQESWKELKGDHFIIYYLQDDKFASEVLSKAEEYYNRINEDLGYERRSNFWQWEHRVKIYIYQTQEEFLKSTGRENWSHGYASYDLREIRSYMWNEGFLESLLPHEMTHLIFRDYVGFQGEIPLWLDEGVAQWEEPAKRAIVKEVMKTYLEHDKGFKLKDLAEVDIRHVPLESAVQLFYVQAASLIDYLIKVHGADIFIFFCRQLRDGKSLDEALRFTYPTKIRSINELEEQWKKYILES